MIRFLFIICTFFALSSRAQNSQKPHFIIHPLNASANVEKYAVAAESFGQLDAYRLYDKRRTIVFSDRNASIELYSAKELLDLYGKEVSPHTLNTEPVREISFDISLDGKSLKPQLLNK